MKLHYKMALISTLSAIALAGLISTGNLEYFLIALGLIMLFVGFIFLIVALVLYGTGNRVWSQAFFLTTAIFILVGSGACGAVFLGV